MPRKPVLPALLLKELEKKHLISALELQAVLKQKGKSFNKTSVYRALEQLIDQGKICKQVLDGTEAVYELRSHHHDHAICTNCQKIQEIPCVISTNKLNLDKFQIDHHHMNVYGICDDCMKK